MSNKFDLNLFGAGAYGFPTTQTQGADNQSARQTTHENLNNQPIRPSDFVPGSLSGLDAALTNIGSPTATPTQWPTSRDGTANANNHGSNYLAPQQHPSSDSGSKQAGQSSPDQIIDPAPDDPESATPPASPAPAAKKYFYIDTDDGGKKESWPKQQPNNRVRPTDPQPVDPAAQHMGSSANDALPSSSPSSGRTGPFDNSGQVGPAWSRQLGAHEAGDRQIPAPASTLVVGDQHSGVYQRPPQPLTTEQAPPLVVGVSTLSTPAEELQTSHPPQASFGGTAQKRRKRNVKHATPNPGLIPKNRRNEGPKRHALDYNPTDISEFHALPTGAQTMVRDFLGEPRSGKEKGAKIRVEESGAFERFQFIRSSGSCHRRQKGAHH